MPTTRPRIRAAPWRLSRWDAREDLEQAAATWIARRDSGAWTEADAASFQRWLAQSAGNRAAYYRLNSAWTEAGRVRALGAAAPATAPVRKPARRLAIFAIAASLSILLAGAFVTFKDEIFDAHRFTTVIGGLQAIPLSDGSRVTLNTDSELRIALNDRERVVEIEHGEAFFEVAHDPARPFIVKAGTRRVIAVGTQFSVRRAGADLRVVVAEGTVRYEGRAGNTQSPAGAPSAGDVVLLPAGSIARAEGDAFQVEQRPVAEAERNLTWRNGFLTFRDTPLADAVAEFNRYNTRKIVIDDPTIAALEVGGVFRSNNVEPFVRLLQRGFAIQAAVRADRIVLTASPGRDR
ncbi:MAG: FecR domain-containing protein [Gammaproteobacteria bacterium]